jgi:HSP20 family protein
MKLPLNPRQSSRIGLTFRVKMIKSSNTLGKSGGGCMAFQPKEDAAYLSVFRQHLDEMFNYVFNLREQQMVCHEFSPLMDIYEAAGAFVIEMDLPGFSEKDFTITLSGSTLRIDGVKSHEKAEVAMSYICLERHFGRFNRIIEIPQAFDPDRMQSSYARGVLKITVPQR